MRKLLLILTLLIPQLSWGMMQSASPEEQAATEAQLQQIEIELKRREAAIGQRAEQLSLTQRELKRLEKQMSVVASELNTTTNKLRASETRIAELEAEDRKLHQQQEQQLKLLEKQIDTAYRLGKHDYLKLILTQRDPSQLERLLGYYGYFNQARLAEVEALRETQAQITKIQASVAAEQEHFAKQVQQQRQQQGVLQAQRADQQQLVKRLQREQSADQRRIEELKNDHEALEQVLDAIIAALRNEPKLDGLSKLKKQLDWPADGNVDRVFGKTKSGGLKWKGVMIRAEAGAPVRAIADGRVLFANWLRGYGLLIVLDHGDGYMSLYGHNQTILPAVGEVVRRNERIGLVGQSGGRENPALYFEIRVRGDAVNPVQWCR